MVKGVPRLLRILTVLGSLMSLVASAVSSADSGSDAEFFELEVRPLLARHCFDCHGMDLQESGLRLDHGEFLRRGGDRGLVIVPGNPSESRFLTAIRYESVDLQMPPGGKLPDSAIAAFTRWIKNGALWPAEPRPHAGPAKPKFDIEALRDAHWAWNAPRRPAVPQTNDTIWPASPIDRFILAKLEAAGMQPANPASRSTLLRRLYFALIGLPPQPEEVDAFLSDTSPEAITKVVDKLLASPRYGERWARHWLDLARYAETRGHEQNEDIKNAWQYRDYVIRAMNSDVPYDQFILEQVAGDQLRPPRVNPVDGRNESVLGTGLYCLSDRIHSPVDLDQALADQIDNHIDVTFKTFQALTVSCARCHDHKFDAVSQEDYFAIYGAFQGSRFLDRHVDSPHQYQSLMRRLEEVHSSIRRETAVAWNAQQRNIGKYLSAARLLVFGGEPLPEVASQVDLLVEDFSGGGFPSWQMDGQAFTHGPIELPVTNTLLAALNPSNGPVLSAGARGAVAASHPFRQLGSKRGPAAFDVRGNELTGSLTNRPFKVDRRYLHFQISGGGDERTALELIVDGQIVRRTTGREAHKMRDERLDLTPWMGNMATLRLVDRRRTGEHGYISVGNLFQSDEPLPVTLRGEVAGSTQAVAEQRELDPLVLSRWVHSIVDQKHAAADARGKSESTEVVDRFLDMAWNGDGPAFDIAPTIPGDFVLSGAIDHPITAILPSGWRHSGILAARLTGTLQSATFLLDQPYLHVRVMGDEARLNLRVSDTQFSSPPLYECLKKHIVHLQDDSQWLTFPVAMWQGRRAYLELIDHPVTDPLDVFRFGRPYPVAGSVGIAEVVISSSATPPATTTDTYRFAQKWCDAPVQTIQEDLARAVDEWPDHRLSDVSARILHMVAKYDLLQDKYDDSNQLSSISSLVEQARHLDEQLDPGELAPTLAPGDSLDVALHIRGDPGNRGPIIPRRFLSAIAGTQQEPITQGDGRLIVARHLASADNPLTARVMVNRLWHHLIGRGLVPTVDNFGANGEAPTHPELLDYLANRFIDLGWSQKRLIREIVLSKTFQMSSSPSNKDYEVADPHNTLLHRANIRRVEAEAIRDAVLTVSGGLNLQMYGPSPPDDGGGECSYSNSQPVHQVEGHERRSIYLRVDRNALPSWYVAFDGPTPITTMGRRSVSNVPAQSLAMMNSPRVIHQAAVWGERIANTPTATDESRIVDLFLRAYARHPARREITEAEQFLQQQRATYRNTLAAADCERLAWRDLCHAIYITKEFIFVR